MRNGTPPLISAQEGWSPADIRAELVRRGITITQIAEALHLGRTAVSQVIAGRSRTPYIRAYIADLIDRPVVEIWPDSAGWDMNRRSAPRRKVG